MSSSLLYSRTHCLYSTYFTLHRALFKSNGPTSVYLCPQAHVSVCESMSDPTGFGFVCMRVCSFPIRTEVHHSSRATATTTCLEWEVPHIARGGSHGSRISRSVLSPFGKPPNLLFQCDSNSSFQFVDNNSFFSSLVVAVQTFSSWPKESVKKKEHIIRK